MVDASWCANRIILPDTGAVRSCDALEADGGKKANNLLKLFVAEEDSGISRPPFSSKAARDLYMRIP